MGEPTSNIRDVIVSFRVTRFQAAHLDAAAQKLKSPRTRADMCRAVVLKYANLNAPPPTKPLRLPPRRNPGLDTRALSAILGQIGKIGSNINQIAHHANAGGNMPTEAALVDIRADILDIKSQLTNVLRPRDGAKSE